MTAINNLPGLAKFNNATHEVDGLMSRNDKQKLDTLDKCVTIHAILYASEWSKNRPYTQTIDLPDITSDTNGTLTIDPLANNEQTQACIDAGIIIQEQSINYMTLQVTETKPEIDIPIIIVYGENLAVITPPTIVDTGNHVHNVIVKPTDWLSYLDTYKTSLYIPGITESVVGSISMRSGINEDEAFVAAKARIEIFNVMDNTVELILKGEKPNIPLHMTVYYGPSIAVVRKPVFGGKITPHAKYQEFDDSKTGLGVTKTQSAIEELILGTTGLNNKTTHFKTVDTMKEAMELRVGQLVTTSGYRYENDGGGAVYLITSDSSKIDNGGSVHILKNNLRAEIVLPRGEDINLKCFGLYADGIHDDTPAFQRGFELCKQIKGGTIRWQGIAAINEPLIVDSHYINIQGYGYGSTIKANNERDYVMSITYEDFSTTEDIKQIQIGNFRIDGNKKAKHGLLIDDNLPVYNSIFENIHIYNTMDFGLVADSCKNCYFNMITVIDCYGGLQIIDDAYGIKFDNCKFIRSGINEALYITYTKEESESIDDISNRASMIQFNGCYIGNSETNRILKIERSIDIDFDRCIFDFAQTLSTDYPIVIDKYALYTRFTDCFLLGAYKTCGMIKNIGPGTTIRNFKAADIKSSDYHILTEDNIHINGLELVGDSTPLVVYTPNDNKTILDVNTAITPVDDDINLFPSNANYYNIYMNQNDELGVKGKMHNYVIEKHIENEQFEKIIEKYNSTLFDVELNFDLPGIWEIDMYLTVDEGNQGRIFKYQIAFKQNSVYSIADIQSLINPIQWGDNIEYKTPTIDTLGNFKIEFNDVTEAIRSWALKIKAKRIMDYDI